MADCSKERFRLVGFVTRPLVICVAGGLLGLATVIVESVFVIAFSITVMTSLVYVLRACRHANKEYSRASDSARPYLFIVTTCTIALNFLALSWDGVWLEVLLADCLLAVSTYPLWHYLRHGESGIPLVPLTALAAGIYYAIPTLLGFEPSWAFRTIAQESREIALM